jgi:cell division protein FtsB
MAYFGYHAFNGDFGIWARERLVADAARLTVDRDRLVAEREVLERRVASVKPESLDADVIDMHARLSLGYIREDEVVIRLGALQQ